MFKSKAYAASSEGDYLLHYLMSLLVQRSIRLPCGIFVFVASDVRP